MAAASSSMRARQHRTPRDEAIVRRIQRAGIDARWTALAARLITYTHTHTHTSVRTHTRVRVCVCVCARACVCVI